VSVEQYLSRYAEPEARLAERIDGVRELAIVLPVLAESERALDGLRNAARELEGRALVILVVNARPSATPEQRQQNAALLQELLRRDHTVLDEAAFMVDDPDFDVLVLDRSSPGRELPLRQGVGLARKIGCDLALALCFRKRLSCPWLFWADADAALPREHFAQTRRALAAPELDGAVALCFPFRHVASGDAEVTRATLVHELCLRYHVLGLASAGSPYAHHSLGSALAVEASAYAAVRGVPKRQAGEDFYLLDKLAKVGKLGRPRGEAITIAARRSPRVPFGTGPRVERILKEQQALVACPEAFRTLGALLRGLDLVALERRAEPLDAPLAALPARERAAGGHVLEALGMRASARVAVQASGSDLRRRLHTWFDALRTLRALHLMREAGLSDVPVRVALTSLLEPRSVLSDENPAIDELERALGELRGRETELPSVLGPALCS
jgi:hypothetical protein